MTLAGKIAAGMAFSILRIGDRTVLAMLDDNDFGAVVKPLALRFFGHYARFRKPPSYRTLHESR